MFSALFLFKNFGMPWKEGLVRLGVDLNAYILKVEHTTLKHNSGALFTKQVIQFFDFLYNFLFQK